MAILAMTFITAGLVMLSRSSRNIVNGEVCVDIWSNNSIAKPPGLLLISSVLGCDVFVVISPGKMLLSARARTDRNLAKLLSIWSRVSHAVATPMLLKRSCS